MDMPPQTVSSRFILVSNSREQQGCHSIIDDFPGQVVETRTVHYDGEAGPKAAMTDRHPKADQHYD